MWLEDCFKRRFGTVGEYIASQQSKWIKNKVKIDESMELDESFGIRGLQQGTAQSPRTYAILCGVFFLN